MEMILCSVASQALVVVVALLLAALAVEQAALVERVAHGLERLVAITPAVLETHLAHLHRKALLAALLETQAVVEAAAVRLLAETQVEPTALMVALALYQVSLALPLTTLEAAVVAHKALHRAVAQVVAVMAETQQEVWLELLILAAVVVVVAVVVQVQRGLLVVLVLWLLKQLPQP
jgi:hypothetical protein